MTCIDPGIYMPEEIDRIFAEELGRRCSFKGGADLSAVLVFNCSTQSSDKGTAIIGHLMDHVRTGKDHHRGGATMADHLKMLLTLKGRKILVVANCCAQFAGTHRRSLEDDFPNIIWHFPAIRDYGSKGISMTHQLLEDLDRLGMLDIEPIAEAA